MNIAIPFAAVPLAQIPSVGFNNNFTEIASKFNTYAVQTDVAKTITAAHTFAADILFTDALYDIGKSGATRPRDIFLSRNLVAGGTITGTLATAAQPNITSLGALAGGLSFGNLKVSTSFLWEDTTNADASININYDGYLGAATRFRNLTVWNGKEGLLAHFDGTTRALLLGTATAGSTGVGGLRATGASFMDAAVTFGGAINCNGGDVLFTDALYDIGKSGATRPRDIFASRQITANTLVTTGGSASNAGLVITPVGADPISPNNGEVWTRNTNGDLKARLNGGTVFIQTASTKVVGNAIGGWNAPTGTQTRGTFDAAATLAVTAQTLVALIADLRTHGLIVT